MSFSKFCTLSTPSFFLTQQIPTSRRPVALTEPLLWKRRQCKQTELFITQQLILRDTVKRKIIAVPRIARVKKVANLEKDIASLKYPRIQMPCPKLMVMVSFCWKINFLPGNIKKLICFIDDILEINDQSCCILSGPPCITIKHSWIQLNLLLKLKVNNYHLVSIVSEQIIKTKKS